MTTAANKLSKATHLVVRTVRGATHNVGLNTCTAWVDYRRFHYTVSMLFCLISVATTAFATELNIAVSANFGATLRELTPHYHQASGDQLSISIGSSGKLTTQIMQGAPYDVFLSADRQHPINLIDKQLADAASRFTYAIGILALWHPQQSITPAADQGFDFRPDHLVALANPRHAPYGKAAEQVLSTMGYWQTLSSSHRLALAESVGQAWHYAASGNADVAFVALSQLKRRTENNNYWLPPARLYTAIIQQGVVLNNSKNQRAARRFCRWLQTDAQAKQVISESGYQLPEGQAAIPLTRGAQTPAPSSGVAFDAS